MKVTLRFAIPLLFSLTLPAQRPWQQIAVPSVREAAANFKTPPREYGAIQPFASWNGPDAKDRMARIVQDLDRLAANGIFVFNMSPGHGEPKYLSPEHMDEVKFVVQEAARRGMKLWLQDESDYPSGFARGLIGEKYPLLTMQGIVADTRISVTAGQTLTFPLPPGTLGASGGRPIQARIRATGLTNGTSCSCAISTAVPPPATTTARTGPVSRMPSIP